MRAFNRSARTTLVVLGLAVIAGCSSSSPDVIMQDAGAAAAPSSSTILPYEEPEPITPRTIPVVEVDFPEIDNPNSADSEQGRLCWIIFEVGHAVQVDAHLPVERQVPKRGELATQLAAWAELADSLAKSASSDELSELATILAANLRADSDDLERGSREEVLALRSITELADLPGIESLTSSPDCNL